MVMELPRALWMKRRSEPEDYLSSEPLVHPETHELGHGDYGLLIRVRGDRHSNLTMEEGAYVQTFVRELGTQCGISWDDFVTSDYNHHSASPSEVSYVDFRFRESVPKEKVDNLIDRIEGVKDFQCYVEIINSPKKHPIAWDKDPTLDDFE